MQGVDLCRSGDTPLLTLRRCQSSLSKFVLHNIHRYDCTCRDLEKYGVNRRDFRGKYEGHLTHPGTVISKVIGVRIVPHQMRLKSLRLGCCTKPPGFDSQASGTSFLSAPRQAVPALHTAKLGNLVSGEYSAMAVYRSWFSDRY